MQIRQPGRISTSSPLAAGIGLLAAFATLSPVGVLNAQAIGPQASPITRQQAEPQAARGEEQEPAVELSLLDAVDLALRHNLQVQINSYQPDLSEEQITNARAQFDPQIQFQLPQTFNRSSSQGTTQLSGADVLTSERINASFSFSETLTTGTNWSLTGNTNRNVTNNTFSTLNPQIGTSATLSVTQQLLRGFGREINRANLITARNGWEGSKESFRQSVEQTIFQTQQAYWQLVLAVRDLEVKQLSLDLSNRQLERNRIQVEIGTLAPIETIQSEQQVAQNQLQLIQSQVALRDAQDDLKRLINADSGLSGGWAVSIVPTDDPQVTTEPIDTQAAIADALEQAPSLRRLRIDLESRKLNLRVQRNALLPQLTFNGSIQLSGQGGDRIVTSGGFGSSDVLEVQQGGINDALQNLLSGNFRNWSVGLTVNFPLRNWAAKAAYAQASINERNVLTQIADQEQQVRVDVTKAARQVESGVEQVAQAITARELAERQLDAEGRKFAVGTSTNFQVLEFQRQLATSRSSELQAIINFNNAIARLEQVKGTLLSSFGFDISLAGLGGNQR